jgi:hypothetical protein
VVRQTNVSGCVSAFLLLIHTTRQLTTPHTPGVSVLVSKSPTQPPKSILLTRIFSSEVSKEFPRYQFNHQKSMVKLKFPLQTRSIPKRVKKACATEGATERLLLLLRWTRYSKAVRGKSAGKGDPFSDLVDTPPPLISVKLCCRPSAKTGAMSMKSRGYIDKVLM